MSLTPLMKIVPPRPPSSPRPLLSGIESPDSIAVSGGYVATRSRHVQKGRARIPAGCARRRQRDRRRASGPRGKRSAHPATRGDAASESLRLKVRRMARSRSPTSAGTSSSGPLSRRRAADGSDYASAASSSPSSSSSFSPARIFSAISAGILPHRGFDLGGDIGIVACRKVLAFSRPWPMRWLS